jgi:hypothetical protein
MSIIAALDAGDCLYLASDSMVTEESGVRLTRQKLDMLPGRPIAWGFSGDEGIGYQFRDWFKAWPFPSDATWSHVADAAIEELSRLNGRKRALGKLAGVETTDSDLADVLIAGYIAGVPDIYELTDRGSASSVKHSVLAAIGSGHAHATIAYLTLRGTRKELKLDQQLLGFAVGMAAQIAPQCGPPVRMLRLTPEGVEELTQAKLTD